MKKQAIFSSNKMILSLILPVLLAATLWACFIAPLPAQAQGGEEELWRTLETPFEYVGQVLEDKEGNIWVMSWTGQVILSDQEITASDYEEIGEQDHSITETQSGKEILWEIIPGEGLAKFEQGDWTIYTAENTNGDLPGDSIHAALFDQEGHLWLAVSENQTISDTVTLEAVGIVRFNGEQWQTFTVSNTNGGLADNNVHNISENKDGNLWFATSGGLSRYDGQNWEVVADKETLGSGTFQVFQDRQNRLWVSLMEPETLIGVGHGVARSAPITAPGAVTGWQTFTEADGLADDYVLSIAEDTEGDVWFGTYNGVSRFDGENWQTFNSDNSLLPYDIVLQVLPGYEGEILDVTESGILEYINIKSNLFILDHSYYFYQNKSNILFYRDLSKVIYYTGYIYNLFNLSNIGIGSNDIKTLFEAHDGAIWVSTDESGVSRYQNSVWQSFTVESGDLGSNEIRNLFEASDGSIWASSCTGIDTYSFAQSCDGGVSRHQDGEWQIFNLESGDLGHDNIQDLFESSDGTVWVGMSEAGVSYYQNGEWHTFNEESGNPKDGNVWELLESSDGAIWIATKESGVSRYEQGEWQTFSVESGALGGNEISYILESSDGAIWVESLETSVSRYQNGEWLTFNEENGDFISNKMGYLREGSDGAIWISYREGGGLSRYQDGSWQYFPNKNLEDMPIQLDTSSIPPSIIDRNGFSWTATNNGLVRSRSDHRPPWLKIKKVNSTPLTTTALTLSNEERQRVFIDFAGNDLVTRPENLQYLYKLENSVDNTDWQQASYDRPIFFDELAPGKYTLLVKAIDEDGLESEPAVLDITVQKPPLTPLEWLVRGLGVVTLGGLVVFGRNWWRERKATEWDIGRHFNPFIGELAVTEPKMFFGRQEILNDVLRSIQATNFVIYGEKRIGKTSLLHQIDHHLSEMEGKHFDYLPLVVSLHAMLEERFFRDVMRKMVARIKKKRRYPAEGLFLECEQETDMPYDSIRFNEDLDLLQSALDVQSDLPLRLVLLVDEGDVLKGYSQDTLAQLRETFMVWAGEYLKIVLTSEGPDERIWRLEGSPWMSIFGKQYRLAPFTDEEARELIVEPVPNYRYQPEAVEQILERSQLEPRHIQNICRQTINEMLADKTGTITLGHIEKALPKVDNLPAEVTDEEEQP